ncbi:hypothetical protein CLV30_12555 [Haloactinopolyspora alba]|uniref:Uncharacterized protein n=1 Tax=Haloactinopolyspora alba TaxID=648780 RepID=A0A2P8DHJ6_9ACTN|nr:hypothetical protein [Haloactinopolyspora alba]PSK96673.1 hypothetical protein CLV30_12555 [Haloactinopolyspora alba]
MTYPNLAAGIRRQHVLDEIEDERDRQDAKWGEQNHRDGTVAQLEDRAIKARDERRDAAAGGYVTWLHILHEEFWEAASQPDPAKLRAELVKVSAVALAWVEALDRRAAWKRGEQP